MKKLVLIVVVVASLVCGLIGYQSVSGTGTQVETPVVTEYGVQHDHMIYMPQTFKQCVNSECTEPIVCIIDDDSREYIPCNDEQ